MADGKPKTEPYSDPKTHTHFPLLLFLKQQKVTLILHVCVHACPTVDGVPSKNDEDA